MRTHVNGPKIPELFRVYLVGRIIARINDDYGKLDLLKIESFLK